MKCIKRKFRSVSGLSCCSTSTSLTLTGPKTFVNQSWSIYLAGSRGLAPQSFLSASQERTSTGLRTVPLSRNAFFYARSLYFRHRKWGFTTFHSFWNGEALAAVGSVRFHVCPSFQSGGDLVGSLDVLTLTGPRAVFKEYPQLFLSC